MRTPTTHRPSSAMVVAMIALFIAIGGTALALPGKNTVNSGDVKDETLKSQDLKDEAAVASSDVINDTLQSEDINDGELQTADYSNGSVLSDDIATDAVGSSEIATGAVGSAEIVDGAVGTAELGGGVATSAKIGNNAVGSGDLATITEVVDPTPHDFGDQDEGNDVFVYGSSQATCPAGSTVIGGAGEFIGAATGGSAGSAAQGIHEQVRDGANGWIAIAFTDVDNQDFRAIAYCLSTGA